MIIPTRKSIRLKRGFTYDDYVIKRNEIDTPYYELCHELNLTFDEAKVIYDKVFNIPLEKIGTIKKPKSKYPYWNKEVAV